MKGIRRILVTFALGWTRRVCTVPIGRCYHYRGFRYGGFGNNPYEDYIVGLAAGAPRATLRTNFAEAILQCRPRTLDEALQIDLGGWPLWEFPWTRKPQSSIHYQDDPAQLQDVVCQYSPKGVLSSHINREFGWLEGAYDSLRSQGYLPRRYGYIRCLELRPATGESSFLVLDGNHRIAALHALGASTAEVETFALQTVRRSAVKRWPRVRDLSFSEAAALRVFDRYFQPRNPPLLNLHPAALIADEPPAWPQAEHAGGRP